MKPEISLSPSAHRIIDEILSNGNEVRITLVGKRLRITEVRQGHVKYDVMVSDTGGNNRQ